MLEHLSMSRFICTEWIFTFLLIVRHFP